MNRRSLDKVEGKSILAGWNSMCKDTWIRTVKGQPGRVTEWEVGGGEMGLER